MSVYVCVSVCVCVSIRRPISGLWNGCLCLIYSLVSLINKPKLAERQKLELDLLNLQGSDWNWDWVRVRVEAEDFFNCVEGPFATPPTHPTHADSIAFCVVCPFHCVCLITANWAACGRSWPTSTYPVTYLWSDRQQIGASNLYKFIHVNILIHIYLFIYLVISWSRA